MQEAAQFLGTAHHRDREQIETPHHDPHETDLRNGRKRRRHLAALVAALDFDPDEREGGVGELADVGDRGNADLPLVLHALDPRTHRALGNAELLGYTAVAGASVPRQVIEDPPV